MHRMELPELFTVTLVTSSYSLAVTLFILGTVVGLIRLGGKYKLTDRHDTDIEWAHSKDNECKISKEIK